MAGGGAGGAVGQDSGGESSPWSVHMLSGQAVDGPTLFWRYKLWLTQLQRTLTLFLFFFCVKPRPLQRCVSMRQTESLVHTLLSTSSEDPLRI